MGARALLATMRPVLMMEVSDSALRAQGSSEAALLEMLRGEFGYEVLVFSESSGLVERQGASTPLSSNIIAVPRERSNEALSGS